MRKFTLIEIIVVAAIVIIIIGFLTVGIWGVAKIANNHANNVPAKQEVVKPTEVIIFRSPGWSQYDPSSMTTVYKFEFEGETYLVSNKGGIIRAEKHQTGEDK